MLIGFENLAGWPIQRKLCDGITIYSPHLLLLPQPTTSKNMFTQLKLFVSTARNEDLRQCKLPKPLFYKWLY